jgi:nicotinamidase-related amidase
MSYSLLVVDMQKYFPPANGKRILANCKKEIITAMKNKAAIIFLEYIGCGPTKRELSALTRGYARVYFDIKDADDGSLEAAVLIRKHKLPKANIRVVGVNTDCCVASTVEGLTQRLFKSKIDVVASACDSNWDHFSGLRHLSNMRNVRVSL